MKIRLTSLITLLITATCAFAQTTVTYVKPSREGSQQGMLIDGNRIFSFAHGGKCMVYNRQNDTLATEGTFNLQSSSPSNHCNQACWGVERVPGASYPVVYISVAQPKSPLDMYCHVESFTRNKKGQWSSKLVQVLHLDTAGWHASGLDCIFGAPSWLIDSPRQALWVLSGRTRTVAKTMPTMAHNKLVATRFRIPALSEGDTVTLGADDILEQVALDMDALATQSGCMSDGRIYYAFGFGDKHPGSETKIRVYDLDLRAQVAGVDLAGNVPEEPEALCLDGNRLLLNTNSTNIYSLPVPTDSFNLDWRGTYTVDAFSAPEQNDAPNGYVPFLISTYCRHGIRHLDSHKTLPILLKVFQQAHNNSNLTPTGQAAYGRLMALLPTMQLRTGDLTAGGFKQWQDYALKMACEYPTILTPKARVRTQSTNVMRTARSMEAFNSALRQTLPQADIRGDVSSSFHTWLNPYANDCPTKLPIDEDLRSPSGQWYALWRGHVERTLKPDEIMKRLFIVPDSCVDSIEFIDALYTLACAAPALDRPDQFADLFTPHELQALYNATNYKMYMQKGRHPVNQGRGWGQAARILENITTQISADVQHPTPSLTMRFGHDGCLMALLALLEADQWGIISENTDEITQAWQTKLIPMASKILFIVYKSPDPDKQPLIKLLLNGSPLTLPLSQVGNNCYSLQQFLEMANAKINERLQAL